MKAVVCAIAKHENLYINDWCKYHLNLGFDDIYVFDNNEAYYPNVEDCIDKDISNHVHFIDAKGKSQFQIEAYNTFYQQHKHEFDWCAFIDIDEFFNLGNFSDFKSFIASNKNFDRAACILFNWQLYGDDGIIEGDVSVPVYERIKKPVFCKEHFDTVKSVIKGGLSDNVMFRSKDRWSHVPINIHTFCNVKGQVVRPQGFKIPKEFLSNEICLKHYITKTLKEFIDTKMNRTDALFKDGMLNVDFGYFFKINRPTPEKTKYINHFKDTTLFNNAFAGQSGVSNVIIPNSIVTIGKSVFKGSSMTSVILPNGLKKIDDFAFQDCVDLREINIPESVEWIGNGAFAGCTSLKEVKLPEGVTSIGYSAFTGCTNLTSVTIPDSVTSIGNSAFSKCSKLTTINYTGTEEQWNAITKEAYWNDNVPSTCVINYNYKA